MQISKHIESYIKRICEEKMRLARASFQDTSELSPDSYSQYLADIVEAMSAVGFDYYQLSKIEGDDNIGHSMYERMFAYEFYHQLRCIMTKHDDVYQGLHLNGEPSKGLDSYSHLAGVVDKENIGAVRRIAKYGSADVSPDSKVSNLFIPDMVLHEPDGLKKQVYLLEIKLQSNKEALTDLRKLTNLKDAFEKERQMQPYPDYYANDPRFAFYIFVYVGHDFEDKLMTYKDASRCDRDIICIYGDSRSNIKCKALGELLD